METDIINISLSLNKEELVCCVCHESLTKQIFQCVKGNHYMCDTCDSKWKKNECPTCRNPTRLIRNIFFEEQLKQHLKPCQNIGCCEKFFKWDDDHTCPFAPIKCRICKREVSGNISSVCSHFDGLCDETFKVINVESFVKRLKIKTYTCSIVMKLPDNFILIIQKCNKLYKLSALKNLNTNISNYKNIICTYVINGIEYSVMIPIVNLNETKIAEIHCGSHEISEFIFSKDIYFQQKPQIQQPPMQQSRAQPINSTGGLNPLSQAGGYTNYHALLNLLTPNMAPNLTQYNPHGNISNIFDINNMQR